MKLTLGVISSPRSGGEGPVVRGMLRKGPRKNDVQFRAPGSFAGR